MHERHGLKPATLAAVEGIEKSVLNDYADSKEVEMAALAQRAELKNGLDPRVKDLVTEHSNALEALRKTLVCRNLQGRNDVRDLFQHDAMSWSREPVRAPTTKLTKEKSYHKVQEANSHIRDFIIEANRTAGAPLPALLISSSTDTVSLSNEGRFTTFVKPGGAGDIRVKLTSGGDIVLAQFTTKENREGQHVTWQWQIQSGTARPGEKLMSDLDSPHLNVNLEKPQSQQTVSDTERTNHADRSTWNLSVGAVLELILKGVVNAAVGASARPDVKAAYAKDTEQQRENTHVESSATPAVSEKVGLSFEVKFTEPPAPRIEIYRGAPKFTQRKESP